MVVAHCLGVRAREGVEDQKRRAPTGVEGPPVADRAVDAHARKRLPLLDPHVEREGVRVGRRDVGRVWDDRDVPVLIIDRDAELGQKIETEQPDCLDVWTGVPTLRRELDRDVAQHEVTDVHLGDDRSRGGKPLRHDRRRPIIEWKPKALGDVRIHDGPARAGVEDEVEGAPVDRDPHDDVGAGVGGVELRWQRHQAHAAGKRDQRPDRRHDRDLVVEHRAAVVGGHAHVARGLADRVVDVPVMGEGATVIQPYVIVRRRLDPVDLDALVANRLPGRRIDVLLDAVALRIECCDEVRLDRRMDTADRAGHDRTRRRPWIGLVEDGLPVVVLVPGLRFVDAFLEVEGPAVVDGAPALAVYRVVLDGGQAVGRDDLLGLVIGARDRPRRGGDLGADRRAVGKRVVGRRGADRAGQQRGEQNRHPPDHILSFDELPPACL